MNIKDYLHLYLGCQVLTPDGEAKLVGLPYTIVGKDRVRVHFGRMVHTKNSIDGGYNKVRNYGEYALVAQRYEPLRATGVTEDGFDMPGGVVPLLRPLSDMTEEEAEKLGYTGSTNFGHWIYRMSRMKVWTTNQFLYLLSRHFDLFGLIPAGLALDKTNYSLTKQV